MHSLLCRSFRLFLTSFVFYFTPASERKIPLGLVSLETLCLLPSVLRAPRGPIPHGSTVPLSSAVCISNSPSLSWALAPLFQNAGHGPAAGYTTSPNIFQVTLSLDPLKFHRGASLPFISSCKNDLKLGDEVKDGEWINIHCFTVKNYSQISIFPSPRWY